MTWVKQTCIGLSVFISMHTVSTVAVETPLPQDAKVADLLECLQSDDPAVRDVADDAIYDLPPTAFPLLEQAAAKKDLTPDASEKLGKAIDIQRPLQAARLRRYTRDLDDYAFNETSALDEYRHVGKHDPKWDRAAEDGIVAVIAPAIYPLHASADEKLQRAIGAGCDDPLLLYLHSIELTEVKNAQGLATMEAAVTSLNGSNYPAFRKLNADARLIDQEKLGDGNLKHNEIAQQAAAAGIADLPAASATPNLPRSWVYHWASALDAALSASRQSRKDAFDQIEPVIEKAMPNSSIPYAIKGQFYVAYAWDARGSGWANTVTDDGWQKMHDRLSTAEEALGKGWALDPTDEKTCEYMLQVELGQGEGRGQMEKWFALAMAADPDDFEACSRKLYYLQPKWYGSEQESLAFARQAGETRRWSSRLPLLICDAHRQLWEAADDKHAYALQPQVWQDLDSAYSRYLRQYGKDVAQRNQYTLWAMRCDHPEVAARQLKLLGDVANPVLFGGKPRLEKLRQQLATQFPNLAATQP